MYIGKKNGRNRKIAFSSVTNETFRFSQQKKKERRRERAEEDEEKSHNERANTRGCGDYILLYTYILINDVPGGSA